MNADNQVISLRLTTYTYSLSICRVMVLMKEPAIFYFNEYLSVNCIDLSLCLISGNRIIRGGILHHILYHLYQT